MANKNYNYNWKTRRPIAEMSDRVTVKCKTLADMTEAEIQALEKQYRAKVIRPMK